MDAEKLREYCLLKEDVEEGFPFGEDVLVFKTRGKMFLLVPLNTNPLQFNAKCDPDKALELREEYPAIQPGYHMNKKHWNTVIVDGTIPDKLLREFIDESYSLIRSGTKKKT